MAFAVPWGLERLTACKAVAGMLLVLGAGMQGLTAEKKTGNSELAGSMGIGLLCAFVSLTFGATGDVVRQHLLQRSGPNSKMGHLSPFEMLWRTTAPVVIVCGCSSLVLEFGALDRLSLEVFESSLLISGNLVLLQAAEIWLVQLTSAVALNVASTLHQIPIVVAGVTLFHEEVRWMEIVGFMLSLVGATMYTLNASTEPRSHHADSNSGKMSLWESEDHYYYGKLKTEYGNDSADDVELASLTKERCIEDQVEPACYGRSPGLYPI